jgi:hypothetical protein
VANVTPSHALRSPVPILQKTEWALEPILSSAENIILPWVLTMAVQLLSSMILGRADIAISDRCRYLRVYVLCNVLRLHRIHCYVRAERQSYRWIDTWKTVIYGDVFQNPWGVVDLPCGGIMVLLPAVKLYITSKSISNKQEEPVCFKLCHLTTWEVCLLELNFHCFNICCRCNFGGDLVFIFFFLQLGSCIFKLWWK